MLKFIVKSHKFLKLKTTGKMKLSKPLLLIILLVIIATSPVFSQNQTLPFYQETKVFWAGLNGYVSFRIPAIITLSNGDILTCAEGRKNSLSDDGDINIVMRKSSDGGKNWSSPQVVADNGTHTAGNPVLVEDKMDSNYPQGRVFLFYCISDQTESNITNGIGIRQIFYKTSVDHGNTWSAPTEITRFVHKPITMGYNKSNAWYWFATGPGHAIQMQHQYQGRIVIPENHSLSNGHYYSSAFFSDDHGATWQYGDTLAVYSNECQIAELDNGSLIINSRNYPYGQYRICGISDDGGKSWGYSYNDSDLVEPPGGCEGSIISFNYKGKSRLLFSNPSNSSTRANLSVKVSYDEGETWKFSKTITNGASAYSDLAILPDSTLGIVFEKDNYQSISFGNFNLQWLTAKTDSSNIQQPQTSFYLPERIYYTNEPVSIINTSTDVKSNDYWIFGNSGETDNSTDINPTVYFPNKGKYFIKLEKRRNNNIDTVAKVVYIKSPEDTLSHSDKSKHYIINPNPSFGMLNILRKDRQPFSAIVRAISENGRIQQEFKFVNTIQGTMDLQNRKGCFFISIDDTASKETHKVIVY